MGERWDWEFSPDQGTLTGAINETDATLAAELGPKQNPTDNAGDWRELIASQQFA